jgi:hypothetical protein
VKRLNPKHDELTRKKIQVTQIINRLTDCLTGKVEMTPSQIRAAEILLKKALPDLAATQITGANDGPLMVVTGVQRAHEIAPAVEDDSEGETIN